MNLHQPEQRVLTVTEAAAQTGQSRWTILRRLAAGELRGRMIGKQWLVDAASIAALGGARGAELRQCDRDIAYYERVIAASPTGSPRHEALLKDELAHRERVLRLIGQAGGKS